MDIEIQGSLEERGIQVQTHAPDGVLRPEEINSVRFRQSEPRGYLPADVESFIFEQVKPSLEWWRGVVHERDMIVHKLGEDMDNLLVENANLKRQLEHSELNEVIGDAMRDGESVAEINTLQEHIAMLTATNANLQQQLASALANQGGAQVGIPVQPAEETYTAEEVNNIVNTQLQQLREELSVAQAQQDPQPDAEQIQQLQQALADAHAQIATLQESASNTTQQTTSSAAPANKPSPMFFDNNETDVEGIQAKAIALQNSLNEWTSYAESLEDYIEEITGNRPGGKVTPPSTGFALPDINPEDL